MPRDAIVAFTGVSGSGKSSLAFGTIYAEAQRRYFESVAPVRPPAHPAGPQSQGGADHRAAARRRAPTAPRHAELPLHGGHADHAVQLAAHAVLPRRQLSGRAPAPLDSDAFSPNTAAGACPECHGLGIAHTVTRGLPGPGPVAEHPRRRHRRLARRVAGQEPARHPHPPGLRRRHPLAEAAQEGPRLDPLHRGTARGGSDARSATASPSRTRAGSGAPRATCCTPLPTPRAPPCASGCCASWKPGRARAAAAAGSGPRRSP